MVRELRFCKLSGMAGERKGIQVPQSNSCSLTARHIVFLPPSQAGPSEHLQCSTPFKAHSLLTPLLPLEQVPAPLKQGPSPHLIPHTLPTPLPGGYSSLQITAPLPDHPYEGPVTYVALVIYT